MAQTPNPETSAAENSPASPNNAAPKNPASSTTVAENPTASANNVGQKKSKAFTEQPLNPLQYRAVRFVSFMLEESKYEISPSDFIKEAVARHLAFYQTKRGIEFPNKMLAELSKLELIPTTSRSEE